MSPLSSPTVSPEEADFSPSHFTPTETPTQQLSPQSTYHITPEVPVSGPPLPPQELCEAAVTSAASLAEEETAAPLPVQVPLYDDATHLDPQEVPVTLTPAAVTVAPSFALTPVPQPPVELLCHFTWLFLFLSFRMALMPRLFSYLQGQDSKHNDDLQEPLNGQPIMTAPVFTKVKLNTMH